MYMRIVRAQPPQGQADELARKWEAFWPERLRVQPGFPPCALRHHRASARLRHLLLLSRAARDGTRRLAALGRECRDPSSCQNGPARRR